MSKNAPYTDYSDPVLESIFRSLVGDYASLSGTDPNPNNPEHHYNWRDYYDHRTDEPGDMSLWPTFIPPDTARPPLLPPTGPQTTGGWHIGSAFKDAGHPHRYITNEDGDTYDSVTGRIIR